MFSPLRKGVWAGWSSSPKVLRRQDNDSEAPGTKAKGSPGVTETEATPVPSPQLLAGENYNEAEDGSGVSKDWERCRESGLPNEGDLLRKDNEALSQRVIALESERDDCLFNMGILLIEKKDVSPKLEELRHALLESQGYLKREQEAHMVLLAELELREQNLKKALGVEKQCVVDLEKALHEMRSEIAETKYTSEKKLADAHALEASLERNNVEIEAKVRATDAKLAEGNRKYSEMARKLEDLDAREYKLQRELSTLNIERKALEGDVLKQREHLRDWENELQEKQRRILGEQRILNEREERTNEMDNILKKKQEEIAEANKKVDVATTNLKSQEEDFKVRLRALKIKERDFDILSSKLEKKEKDLITIEEKLSTRESVGIQKLLDEHNAALDAKKQDFELEMVKEKRSFDEEVKNHMDLLDKEKRQIKCKEEQIIKKEVALENRNDKLKSEEKNLDIKSKSLKEWEDAIKSDEKKLQEEKELLSKKSSELEDCRAKLQIEKAAIEEERQKVILEKENLKIVQEEREHHLKLQAELKLEIKGCHVMMESLEKEKEVLSQEKKNFEKDWEVLDEKRVATEVELKQLSSEREKFEKWCHTEKERLKNEAFQVRTDLQRDLEDLRLKKETFEKMMAQDRAEVHAEVDRKLADMAREFDLLKHELEMDVQRRLDEAEKKLKEKEDEFEKWREEELSYIKSSTESHDSKCKKLEMLQMQLQREKEELSDQRRKLDVDQHEIQNDVDTLLRLSKNLKGQREGFRKEKKMFLSVIEKCKSCQNCGVPINKIDLGNLPSSNTEGSEEILLPSLENGFLEEHIKGRSTVTTPGGPVVVSPTSGSQMTRWFQRCTRLFRITPQKSTHSHTEGPSDSSFSDQLDMATLEGDADYQPAPSADHSFENQTDLDSGVGGGETVRVNNPGEEAEVSFNVADSAINIGIHKDSINQKSVAATCDESYEMQGSSMHAENDAQSEPSKQRRLQPTRCAKLKFTRRTRSVKATVEDAKAILGENFDLKIEEQQNSDVYESQNIPEVSRGALAQVGQAVTGKRKERHLIEQEPEGSEAHSKSVSLGGLSKRQHTSLPSTTGDKRYYFRHSTVASTAPKASLQKKVAKNAKRTSHHPQSSGAVESSVKLLENPVAIINVDDDSEKIFQNVGSVNSGGRTAGDGDEVAGDVSADHGNSASDDDDDDDDEKHTASVGKKLWHFLTT